MGYGFPAALAMKILHPDRAVVCIAGDGDFLMTGQDFATAVAIPGAGDRDHRRQQPVWHHPHAPGSATIPAAWLPPN